MPDTYAVLLEEERCQLAAGYLGRSLSIAEVSFLLGDSEPSVFHRAFKRWWGMSPEAFRRARACGGA